MDEILTQFNNFKNLVKNISQYKSYGIKLN